MRFWIIALAMVALLNAACGGEAASAPTARPAAVPAITPTNAPAPTLKATIPAAIPATAEAKPTPAPAPTATPAATPVPTAAPTATPVPPNTAVFDLGEGITLLMFPKQPIAGRDVVFSLSGLSPWEGVSITFTDPVGTRVGWIDVNDQVSTRSEGGDVITRVAFADSTGTTTWTRYGIQDAAGTWRVTLDFDDRKESMAYQLQELQLTGLESFHLGPHMNGLQGPEAGVFFSDEVHPALAVDVQARLALASAQMAEVVGKPPGPAPDLYMVGNRVTLDILSQATLVELGWQGGYYRSYGFKPGVYILADNLRTRLESVVVHEYIHHVVDGIVDGESVPAWLNEGLAGFYEYELGLERPRPNAFKLRLLRSADAAHSAALSGSLFPLASLESQGDWNSRSNSDEISLQYDQAYMAIRFMSETFGASSPFDALREIAAGADFPEALQTATSLTYEDYESGFVDWLSSWEDPDRADATEYFQALDSFVAQLEVVSNRRGQTIRLPLSNNEFVVAYSEMVSDAQEVVDGLALITPPGFLQDIHAGAAAYFGLMVRWLGLELEYQETLDLARQEEANALLPEVNARRNLVPWDVADAKWVLNLP